MTHQNRHTSHCSHALAVCEACDMAYCSKCNREWGVKARYPQPPWDTKPYAPPPWTVGDFPPYGTTTVTTDHTNHIGNPTGIVPNGAGDFASYEAQMRAFVSGAAAP